MSGHGWVVPLPSGVKARCGGPALCPDCQDEASRRVRFVAAGVEVLGWTPEYAGQVFDAGNLPVSEFTKALEEVCQRIAKKSPGGGS